MNREQRIADARALLDWLTANPDVPVGEEMDACYIAVVEEIADDTVGIARVREIAALAGCDYVTSTSGTHHYAVKRIGTATYRAIYIARSAMVEHKELIRLGSEALKARKAASDG